LLGQQIKLAVDSTSSQPLSTNACNCRTKSVQILTPSQEKDESDLWLSSENQQLNKDKSFGTKYCAKCDKILIGTDSQYNNTRDQNNYSTNYCSDCDLDYNESNLNSSCGHNSRYHQQSVINNTTTDNLSLYSIHMEKDFRYLSKYI